MSLHVSHRGVHWCSLGSAECLGNQYRGVQREREETQRITRLATYNAEVARGVLHTAQWEYLMRREQEWFDSEPGR